MFQLYNIAQMLRAGCQQILVTLAACLLLSGIVSAQDLPAAPSRAELPLPATTGLPLRITFPTFSSVKANNTLSPASSRGAMSDYSGSSITLNASVAPPEVRRITLDDAQQIAGGASNPL